jgi:hypothetical protein
MVDLKQFWPDFAKSSLIEARSGDVDSSRELLFYIAYFIKNEKKLEKEIKDFLIGALLSSSESGDANKAFLLSGKKGPKKNLVEEVSIARAIQNESEVTGRSITNICNNPPESVKPIKSSRHLQRIYSKYIEALKIENTQRKTEQN